MSVSKIPLPGEYLGFASFDPTTKKLLYSKYNFNFTLYSSDRNYVGYTKNQIFYDFLFLDNKIDFTQPFVVKDELKKYFTPITPEIENYFDDFNYLLFNFNNVTLSTFVTKESIMQNEFNLNNYNLLTEVPSLCEFLHIDENNVIYSKYNFNFNNYSNDFKVYGSKLAIFNDFLYRLRYLSGNVTNISGVVNIPNIFLKYFYLDSDSQNTLKTYLQNYSVFSPLPSSKRNMNIIDFEKYSTTYNLNMNIDDTKKYFLKYGQFQQNNITFIKEEDDIIKETNKSICYVFTKKNVGTGFLFSGNSEFKYYNGVQQIYLVTNYHIIESENKDVIYASCYYDENTSIKLLFRIIGYDVYTDVCVAVYDPYLDYNKFNFAPPKYDIYGKLKTLDIYGDVNVNIGDDVFIIGNLGLIDNSSFLQGKVIDNKFSGTFRRDFLLSYPPCILSEIHISAGNSGSPIFIKDNNMLKCVGMINGKTGDNTQYSISISSNLFLSIINFAAKNAFNVMYNYGVYDIEKFSFYIREPCLKKWLGCVWSYYNPVSSVKKNGALSNFTQNIGVVIQHFILGFNTQTKKYVYDYNELAEQGVIKIDTPLLKTKLYQRFVLNDKIPIILKSVNLYNKIEYVYDTFNLGKYENQSSFDVITFGLLPSGVTDLTGYTNIYKNFYPKIKLEYYYYNGSVWVLDSEEIGGNDSNWFNEYSDSYGHKFLQHKFEFPQILTPYLNPFLDSIDLTPEPKTPERIVREPIVREPIVREPIVREPIVREPIVREPIVREVMTPEQELGR